MKGETDVVHCFDTEVARKIGIIPAVILGHIYYWVEKNRANDKHFYDGRYWTYNSIKAFGEQFPYLTERQLRYALDKLKEDGCILTGNYNETQYDRTLWYALTDVGYAILQNRQMDLEKSENRFAKIVKPIPDIKPDIYILSSSSTNVLSEANICAELQGNSTPAIILNDKTLYRATDEDVALWKDCYPAVDVEQELLKMAAWSDGNPKLRKTRKGVRRFITNWLARAQDEAGRYGRTAAPTNAAGAYHHNSKAYKCAAYLNRKLGENVAQYVPAEESVIQRWAADFDALSRSDGYDMAVVGEVLAFAMKDDFWRDKILDGRKFRDKFTTLLAQMEGKGADG